MPPFNAYCTPLCAANAIDPVATAHVGCVTVADGSEGKAGTALMLTVVVLETQVMSVVLLARTL